MTSTFIMQSLLTHCAVCSQYFPDKKSCAVPSGIDYLRLTPIDKLT